MLTKSKRLRAHEVVEVLKLKTAVVARSAHLQVRFSYSKDEPFMRSAAVVAKAVAKSAVSRNNIRRALYGALAKCTTQEKLQTTTPLSGHAVFFVKINPTGKVASVFAQEIPQLLASLETKVSSTK